MTIENYIINELPLQSIDKTMDALEAVFHDFPHSHLPVGRRGVFIGCISENDLQSFSPEKSLSDFQHAIEVFFVRETDPWLNVLEVFAQNKTTLMPVLNAENQYVGYVELNDVIKFFNLIPFLSEAGGILIIEKGMKDYSFSEISQIVESNSSQILGMFISKIQNDIAQITLKISSSGINEVIQSFRRYGYNIVSGHQEDRFRQGLKERAAYLTKYLNI